jgi:ATP-dependent DNA helicase RecG
MTIAQASPATASVRYLKGVGPRRMSGLARLGIETVEDVCYTPPRRYEDRTQLRRIAEAQPGQPVTVRGRVLSATLRRLPGRRTLFEATIGDDSGTLQALWFNQPYLGAQVHANDEFIFYGTLEPRARRQFIHPDMERIDEEDDASIHMGRIVPIYSLTAGMSQRWFRQVVWTALERAAEALPDPLPPAVRSAGGWPPLPEAVRALHFPASGEALERARARLAFQELFVFQEALARRRAATRAIVKPQRYQLDGPLLQALRRRLPFELTPSQQRVVEELLADLGAAWPMRRLLQGDVGCGKTIVLILLMAVVVQSGYQAALMAPTELLAEQHARVVRGYLKPLGVSVGLLSQSVAPAQRAQTATRLARGELDVAIGTHALIQRPVVFKRLALAIIDEQHKFGVLQRAHLAKKAQQPDVIVVTATPIPRTLALSLYGDLDVSTITELPPGRLPVATRWLRESQREQAYARIREALAYGEQAYVVYPLVREGSSQELKAATQMAKRLQAEVFPSFRVALLHGQMPPARKEATMRAFARGALHVLVSTVIVEVGLDVPNATVMVIEHPERFGLAQLHQLRGRIGRGARPATCLILSDAQEEPVRARLEAFTQTTDGFALAERDLELRGPGELLRPARRPRPGDEGPRQHGWMRFRIADLARDRALLDAAREQARAVTSGSS